MKYTMRNSHHGHAFNHMYPNGPQKPARTPRPVAIFERAAKKFRASSSRQRLKRTIYWLTHHRKRGQLCAYTPVKSSHACIASEMSTFSPDENPMVHFLSTEEEYDEFLEARRRIPAQANASSLVPTPPSVTPKTKGRSLDDLPPEILIKIWKYIAETPSWFHIKYGSRHIYPITTNTNREHWINRRWYFATELRTSLTQHPIQDSMYHYAKKVLYTTFLYRNGVSGPLVQATADTAWSIIEWSRIDTGRKPFKIHLEGVDRFPIVRPAVDWFFFENYVSALSARAFKVDEMPPDWHLQRVSTVVLKLEDIYTGICRALNHTYDGRPREPWRVDRSDVVRYNRKMSMVFGTLVEYTAELEKCMILVGDLRPSVQPADLQEISVEWAGAEKEFSTNIQREVITSPKVSPNDRAMIRFVHQELEYFGKLQREWRNDLLRSTDGQAWLADVGHGMGSRRSKWLASSEGRIWRETTEEGRAWLQTESGYWWLASVLGSPWLETPKGLEWLDSAAGALFLGLPMARVWAGVDNDAEAETWRRSREETRGALPRKKWFGTEKGRAWVAENCPNYLVPIAPEPPLTEDAGNSGVDLPVRPAQFLTRPLPHWTFVMVPAQVENQPRLKGGGAL
ncbi:hypothetical protein F4824DRAFT_423854 [Ustulina deusta]|nr:hypothetical protein F4824DRAFT_423854 [Ustulina deusta]